MKLLVSLTMNQCQPKRQYFSFMLVFFVVFFSFTLAALPPHLALVLRSELGFSAPCLASTLGPPSLKFQCRLWYGNVDAAPTYDPSRHFIFSGGPDEYLYVLDSYSGQPITQIKTNGRVVTETFFNNDGSVFYVGTEKGYLLAFNAYTFVPLFDFLADSKINNDLVIIDDLLVFTTNRETVYGVDFSGVVKWSALRPLKNERLHMATNSNLLVFRPPFETDLVYVIVPHADGYLSILDSKTGTLKNKVELGITSRTARFPDIVSPIILKNNKLWVASYELGLFALEVGSWQISRRYDLLGILQLAEDENRIFAASDEMLYAINLEGKILWQNNLSSFTSKSDRYGHPFNGVNDRVTKLFKGRPSRLLVNSKILLMATDLSSIGVFDLDSGRLLEIVGNGVGFGPKIAKFDSDGMIAVSKNGYLYKFQFSPQP